MFSVICKFVYSFLSVLLFLVSFFEIINGAAIYDASKGSGRKPGEFNFDPLGFSKDPKARERYATNEIKNGRLAMLAFAGIVTQAALFPEKAFPYF
jgi:light-harvesting complex I chlorophyll a/b binding protein 1